MKKETFIAIINAIEQHMTKVSSNSELLAKVFDNCNSADFIPHTDISEQLIKLLVLEFDDKAEWISYYCYDLDFGKESYRLKVTDSDGNIIPLNNPEDLYNLLTK